MLSQQRTKLRFCNDIKRKIYLTSLSFQEAQLIMKTRLNMLEVKCNYKGSFNDLSCNLCKCESDTTEHLFDCPKIKEIIPDVPDINLIKMILKILTLT